MEFITLKHCQLNEFGPAIASSIGGSIVPPTHCSIPLYIVILLSYIVLYCPVLFYAGRDCLEGSSKQPSIHTLIMHLIHYVAAWATKMSLILFYLCSASDQSSKQYIPSTICQAQLLPLTTATPYKSHSN